MNMPTDPTFDDPRPARDYLTDLRGEVEKLERDLALALRVGGEVSAECARLRAENERLQLSLAGWPICFRNAAAIVRHDGGSEERARTFENAAWMMEQMEHSSDAAAGGETGTANG